MGRKAQFGDQGVSKPVKGPGRKAKKQKPPKMLPGLPKLEGNYNILDVLEPFSKRHNYMGDLIYIYLL